MKKIVMVLFMATLVFISLSFEVEASSRTSSVGITFVEPTGEDLAKEELRGKLKETIEEGFISILTGDFNMNRRDNVETWSFKSMSTRITVTETARMKEYLIVNAP